MQTKQSGNTIKSLNPIIKVVPDKLSGKKGLVLLDRDGTLIKSVVRSHTTLGSARDVHEVSENQDMYSQVKLWASNNLGICVISNQPELSNGALTIQQLDRIDNLLIEKTKIDAFLYCPHSKQMKCLCRKPANQMLETAVKLFSITRNKTLMIGDRVTDIRAAANSKIEPIHLIQHEEVCTALPKHIDVNQVCDLTKVVLRYMFNPEHLLSAPEGI